jgi:hypothetical protein
MKITRKQLRRIIKEETHSLLREASWHDQTGSDLLDFAKAYASLGGAVQEQVNSIVSAYYGHGSKSQEFKEAVYDVNPSAIEMAIGRMGRAIRYLGTERAEVFMSVLEEAQEIYMKGDDEIEDDRQAHEEPTLALGKDGPPTPEKIALQRRQLKHGFEDWRK